MRALAMKLPVAPRWVKKAGMWGFLFFLVKGLVWIGIALWGLWMAA